MATPLYTGGIVVVVEVTFIHGALQNKVKEATHSRQTNVSVTHEKENVRMSRYISASSLHAALMTAADAGRCRNMWRIEASRRV